MAKKIVTKKKKPPLSILEIELLQERVGNMTQEEQAVIATALDSSILETELILRRIETGDAIKNIATQIRRVNTKWAQ